MKKQEQKGRPLWLIIGIAAVNIILMILTHPDNAIKIFLVWILTAVVFRIIYSTVQYLYYRNQENKKRIYWMQTTQRKNTEEHQRK